MIIKKILEPFRHACEAVSRQLNPDMELMFSYDKGLDVYMRKQKECRSRKEAITGEKPMAARERTESRNPICPSPIPFCLKIGTRNTVDAAHKIQ